MKLKHLLQGLKNYNDKGQLESSSLPWFNHSDFKAFLMRCYHNSVPIYGVDIYQVQGGMAHHVQSLLARDVHYTRQGLYYRQWNRHLMEHELEQAMPYIRTRARSLKQSTPLGAELFPLTPLIRGTVHLDTAAGLEELCFVPAGDWEGL